MNLPKLDPQVFKSNVTDEFLRADNAKGDLAWKEAHILHSLMDAYAGTRDRWFLDKMIAHVDELWQYRDDRRGKVDELRNRVMPGWGSSGFGKDKWHVWLVHTGMITFPIAGFVRAVYESPELHAQYKAKADACLAQICELIDAFDDEWYEFDDKGYYEYIAEMATLQGFPRGPHQSLPHNMYLIGATALLDAGHALELQQRGRGQKYLQRAERMLRNFKSHLRPGSKPDTYAWDYWHYPERGARIEDASHGAFGVIPAFRAWKNGLVFTRDDMVKFANTFKKIVLRPDGNVSKFIDGTGETSDYFNSVASFWLDLAEVDPEILEIGRQFVLERKCDFLQVGFAKLLRYSGKF
ncbi:MAG TPA: hypothetical protein VEJ63_19250 [Planctomycetota bacterium]|nr:hypothetical protein [Planctomycetota bacterium]